MFNDEEGECKYCKKMTDSFVEFEDNVKTWMDADCAYEHEKNFESLNFRTQDKTCVLLSSSIHGRGILAFQKNMEDFMNKIGDISKNNLKEQDNETKTQAT